MLVGHSYQNEVELVLHKHTGRRKNTSESWKMPIIRGFSELE